jgi:hypothetical protein
MTIFYCLRFQTPPTGGQVPVFVSPRDRVAQLYPTGFPFRHFLRFAELRWRYSNPPPHGHNKKFWEELIAYFPLIRHESHRKRRLEQFFCCCVCICCHGNVYSEPLPSNNRELHIQPHRLMGGTYKERRSDGLRCHDNHTKFYNDWFRHSKVDRGTHKQHDDLTSLLLFFLKIRKAG